MGVDRLERKDEQPFYNVLVEDGSNRFDMVLVGSGPSKYVARM